MADSPNPLTDPKAWDDVADDYEEMALPRLLPFSEAAIEWAQLDRNEQVLDVACGPGTTSFLLASKVASVEAIDFSQRMLDRLELRRARAPDGQDKIRARLGDAMSLDFEEASFDAAFSMFGLVFFRDPIAGLRELARVLRPGGRVLVSAWVAMPESEMVRPLAQAIRTVLPPKPGASAPSPMASATPEGFCEMLRRGGFEQVEVRRIAPRFAFDGVDRYWEEMRSNIFMKQLRKTLGEAWPETESRLVDALHGICEGVESLEMPGLVARGVVPVS